MRLHTWSAIVPALAALSCSSVDGGPCTPATLGLDSATTLSYDLALTLDPCSAKIGLVTSQADLMAAFAGSTIPQQLDGVDFSKARIFINDDGSTPDVSWMAGVGTTIIVGRPVVCRGAPPPVSCTAYIVHGTTASTLQDAQCPGSCGDEPRP